MNRVAQALLALTLGLAGCSAPSPTSSSASHSTSNTVVHVASPGDVQAFFAAKGRTVVSFLGYSGAGYEDEHAMLRQAARILDEFEPVKTIINIGATADGIGAVYEIAKRRGFITTGIVSIQARDQGVALSPFVDVVFYVPDATWGGFLPGSRELAPTSAAMVASSDELVAIGGGEVARDELLAGREAGRNIRFFPADMNHRRAIEKARAKGLPVPSGFEGAAAGIWDPSGAKSIR